MSRFRTVAALVVCVIFSATADAGDPGSLTVVAREDRMLFVEARGMADVENEVAINARTVFRIASLTKQFTAVATLSLVQNGALSLRDRLGVLLPGCPAAWRSINVEQLLSHTSGLSDDMTPILARLTQDFTPADLVGSYRNVQLRSAPGMQWRYSNLNYWILGLVIEQLSGMSYAAVVQARVLAPAGLKFTRLGDHTAIIAGRARGYVRGPDGVVSNAPYFSPTIGYAAGGLVSNGEDLVRLYAALAAGRLLSPATLNLALFDKSTSDGKSTGYGLGWYVGRVCSLRAFHHGGSSPGFAAYLYWIPQAHLVAFALKNHDDEGEPKDAVLALAKRYLGC